MPGLADALDDPAGQGGDISAAVAADLGLVVHAAQADADELAAQRLGDALAQRGLAGAGRPGEAEDRALHVLLQLADRQVLEDPLLDLLQVVVVGVEDLAGPAEVEPVAAGLAPGQDRQPVEVGPDDRVFRRAGVHRRRAARARAPPRSEPRCGGLGLLDPLPQLADLGVLALALAQLLLDRLELLAEEMVALGLGQLAADLLLDLGRELQHRELPREVLAQPLQPGADVDLARAGSASPRS